MSHKEDIPARHWHETDGYHIDVSTLSPPEPMVAVLEVLERAEFVGSLYMHHVREPLQLYPELLERGWEYEIVSKSPVEITLKISRRK